tara:strand:- start:94124 stop:94552 length:429 start_codon:yes stop_codon:yes gene_type:complete
MRDFIALEGYMLNSPAWRSLSLNARCAFLELLSIYNGRNNGRIALSARSLADRLPISRATAARAFNELESKGFIEAVRKCAFNIKSGQARATEWRLTIHFCDVTNERPSKRFMHWQAGKFHLAASCESQSGFTREPQTLTAQ